MLGNSTGITGRRPASGRLEVWMALPPSTTHVALDRLPLDTFLFTRAGHAAQCVDSGIRVNGSVGRTGREGGESVNS